MVERLFFPQKFVPKLRYSIHVIRLLLTLILLLQANAKDDVVDAGAYEPSLAQDSFIYSSSTQKIDTSKWIHKGAKVKYTPDPLVTGSCATTNPVRVLVADESNSSSYSCKEGTLMSDKFAEVLGLYLKSCAQEALTAAGVKGTIQNVDLNSIGIIVARRVNQGNSCKGQSISSGQGQKCPISYHATGRAVDATSMDVTLTNGTKTNYPLACVKSDGSRYDGFDKNCQRSGVNGTFYDSFNACWNKNLKKHSPCADGVITCEDAQHRDHVHMSLPLCPKVRGIATS